MARKTSRPAAAVKTRSAVHSEEHARQFAWVDWLAQRTGLSDAAMAKEAGLNVNYVYRKRADGTVLGPTQVRMLSDHFGLPGPDTYLMPGAGGLSDEGSPFDIDGQAPGTRAAIEALLSGRPNAASWHLKTRALEDAGYQPGDVVIYDQAVLPQAGDVVVAQVYDVRRGTAETVFRIFEAPYLVAASADPTLRKPLLVDNERVIVVGTVIASFRFRRR